jgi:hypothetical protein
MENPDLMIAVGDDAPEKSMGANGEQCVPLETLAMPGDGEQMTNPEVGDPVSYTIEGKVTRIEGGNAYVKPETINGKPFAAKTPENPEAAAADQDEAGLNELKGMADQQGYMG